LPNLSAVKKKNLPKFDFEARPVNPIHAMEEVLTQPSTARDMPLA
jgi:hypothetical protein